MGRASREKRERKISESKRQKLVVAGVKRIKSAGEEEQLAFIDNAVKEGKVSNNTIRRQLEQNAPKAMWDGILKFSREGKPLTVDALLEEYHADKGFQKMALNAGLDEQWFIDLANQKLELYREQQKQKQTQPEEKQWHLQPVTTQTQAAKPESVVHKLLRKLHLA